MSDITAHLWMVPMDAQYHPSVWGNRPEDETGAIIREQLHRLVPPGSHRKKVEYREPVVSQKYIGELCREADEICAHRIPLFGDVYDFGQEINWSCDPISGYEWPLIPSYRIDLWSQVGLADIRHVWELSAFRHAVILGQAYWLTREERYAAEYLAQLRHWASYNQLNRGANWQCSMMVAIRAANVIWAYAFFVDSPTLDRTAHIFLHNLLRLHGLHIFHNLENKASVRGNHYLANLAGLVHLSCVLPVTSETRKWFRFAVKELDREVSVQILPDGLSFESSLPYHGLVAEMLLHTVVFAGKLGMPELLPAPARFSIGPLRRQSERLLGEKLIITVEKMIAAAGCCITPGGYMPQVGDNDGSRWVKLSGLSNGSNDHRHLFSIAGEFFDRDDFRQMGGVAEVEAGWVFSDIPQSPKPSGEIHGSHLFRQAGICTMRNGDDYLIIRCGALGTAGKGTHTHNDNLSFELWSGRRPYIVDPGSYTYLRDPELRNMFRSTAYHNTLRIDEIDQHRSCLSDLFQLFPESHAEICKWESGDDGAVFRGKITPVRNGGGDLCHQREFRFARSRHCWMIIDEVLGGGLHKLEWFFHIHPGVIIKSPQGRIVLQGGTDGGIILTGDLIDQGVVDFQDAWFSPGYNQKMKCKTLHICREVTLPIRTCLEIKAISRGLGAIPNVAHLPFAWGESGEPLQESS